MTVEITCFQKHLKVNPILAFLNTSWSYNQRCTIINGEVLLPARILGHFILSKFLAFVGHNPHPIIY